MSKSAAALPVIEWSPAAVAAFDPATGHFVRGQGLLDIAAKLTFREALFAVSRRTCFVRTVTVPDAPKVEAMQALALSLPQHVPIPNGEVCYDIRLTGERSAQGRVATLVAMRATELRLLSDQAKAAGIRIAGIVPVAVGSWMLGHGHAGVVAVVSEGVEGLAVDILADGELRHSRSLPPDLPLDSLDGEICRTFSAAGVPCGQTLAAGITLKDVDLRAEQSPAMALADLRWRDFGVDLELPETIVARNKARQAVKARAAALLCVAAGLLATLVAVERADAQSAVNRRRAQMAASVRKLRASRDALMAEAATLAAIQKTLDRGFKPVQKATDVITIVNDSVPENVWLTGINFERGKSLLIRGAAFSNDSVSNYLAALSKEPRLRDVRLIFANQALIESTPVVQFSLSAFPVGNLPLAEDRSARSKR